VGIGRARLLLDFRFFDQHDRNVIPDRVDALALRTLQAALVGLQGNRRFAQGTNQDVQEVFADRHMPSKSLVYQDVVWVKESLTPEFEKTKPDHSLPLFGLNYSNFSNSCLLKQLLGGVEENLALGGNWRGACSCRFGIAEMIACS